MRRVAGAVEEQAEDLEGLGVELDADALLAELSGGGVGFEDSEAIALRWGLWWHVLGSVYPMRWAIDGDGAMDKFWEVLWMQ